MGQPYVGEIRMFAGNFNPNGWMFCEGAPMPISENEVLFQLIGTTYGGDGEETFVLPNLASRVPIHMGTGPDGTTYQLGEMAGTEQETLTVQQIPVHSHPMVANTAGGNSPSPAGTIFAKPSPPPTVSNPLIYGSDPPVVTLDPSAVAPTGGSQPHENTQPFLCISFIISLFGVFPTQT
jgi:microcystin-dependent protein